MTPADIEFCLRDFHATHKTVPSILIANDSAYENLIADCAVDEVTQEVWFLGVKVIHDPLVKGIVVSS